MYTERDIDVYTCIPIARGRVEARSGESAKQAKAHSTDILLARNCLSGSLQSQPLPRGSQ